MKRTDLRKILIIGSGPIVIGQGCEFDYSGVQAVKALKKLGYEVVLVNSNPATVMTDPDRADRTYIEPLTADYLHEVIRRERPDALLPTLGGQTALNLAMELDKLVTKQQGSKTKRSIGWNMACGFWHQGETVTHGSGGQYLVGQGILS